MVRAASYRHQDFRYLAGPGHGEPLPTVTLILPARNVAGTIGAILDTVGALNDRCGLIGQVAVIDADVVLLLASDRSANVTGADITIDGGLIPTW